MSCNVCSGNFQIREGQLTPVAIMCDPNGLLPGGGGAGVRTDQVGSTYFRAINSGVGYSLGDILQKFVQFDSVALTPTANIEWFNVNTNTFIGTPLNADIFPVDKYRLLLTSETITVSNVAVGLTTIPATANYAEIQAHDANLVFTYDGTTIPSTGPDIGVVQTMGSFITLQSRDEIVNFNAIRQNATDARIYVQYLTAFNANIHT